MKLLFVVLSMLLIMCKCATSDTATSSMKEESAQKKSNNQEEEIVNVELEPSTSAQFRKSSPHNKNTIVMETYEYSEPRMNVKGEYQRMNIDVFYPENSTQEMELFVLIHGGGFIGGDTKSSWNLAKKIAMQGYVVATVEYRRGFDFERGTRYSECILDTLDADAAIEMAVEDFEDGLASLLSQERMEQFNIKKRVYIYGSSAGGLITLYSILQDVNFGKRYHIAGAIAGKGSIDFSIQNYNVPLFLRHNQNDPISPYYEGKPWGCSNFKRKAHGGAWIYDKFNEHGGRAQLVTSCWGVHGGDFYSQAFVLEKAYAFFNDPSIGNHRIIFEQKGAEPQYDVECSPE